MHLRLVGYQGLFGPLRMRLVAEDKQVVDEILASWVLEDDERRRFDLTRVGWAALTAEMRRSAY